MVGHTHENIDQMFSCVARRLAKNAAHTLEALKEQIKVSYTPPVLVEELSSLFEIKAWMENSINNISGHVHQHVFKIQNNNGNSKLFYKKWSTSPVWLPDGGISLISTIPRGVPKLVKPNTLGGMSLDKLEMDLPKYAMKLKDSEMVWWREFITKQRNRHQQPDRTKKWDSDALENTICQVATAQSTSSVELSRLVSREEREVEVTMTITKNKHPGFLLCATVCCRILASTGRTKIL